MPQNQQKPPFHAGSRALTVPPARRDAANAPQPQPERYPLSELGQQQRRKCPWLPSVELS